MNIFLLGLLNSRQSNGLFQDQFHFVFGFISLDFSYLFNASTRYFCTLSFAQSRFEKLNNISDILFNFSKLSAILNHKGKTFVMIAE